MKVNNKAAHSMMNDRAIQDLNKDSGIKKSNNKTDALRSSELMESTKLNLSPQAKQISKATEIAKNDSVDEAKVARLQAMIDKGEYKVDAEKVANELVNEHLIFRS